MGMITEDGCDLPMETYYDSSFMIPFKISSELPNYGSDLAETILQEPIISNGRYTVFMEFAKPTTYVIRVTAVFKQSHVLAINGEKQTFKNYDIGMFTCKFKNKLKMNSYAKISYSDTALFSIRLLPRSMNNG